MDALFRFGQYVGIAFQVADDTLDYTADGARLGKTLGQDLRQGKATLPLTIFVNAGAGTVTFGGSVGAGANGSLADLDVTAATIHLNGASLVVDDAVVADTVSSTPLAAAMRCARRRISSKAVSGPIWVMCPPQQLVVSG